MGKGLRRALALGISFFATALAGELFLRLRSARPMTVVLKDSEIHVVDERLGYRMVPNRQAKNVKTNSLALRGPEVALEKPKNGYRILCVGDSITFGEAASCNETTYPAVLERKLNERFDPPREIQVLNAGVMGYASLQCRRWLEELLPRLKPDLVLLCAGTNDFHFSRQRGWHAEMSWTTPRDAWSLDESFLLDELRGRFTDIPHRPLPRLLDAYKENVSAAIAQARAQGSAIALLDLPSLFSEHMSEAAVEVVKANGFRLAERESFVTFRNAWREVAENTGTPVIPTGLEFEVGGKEGLLVDLFHPNDRGYERMVEVLAPAVSRLIR